MAARRIQSLDRALELLDQLRLCGRPLGLKELCAQTGLNPATAHLLLRTLAAHNYVEQNSDSRKYELGLAIIDGGQRGTQRRSLPMLIEPYARRAHEAAAETIMVRTVREGQIYSLLEFEGPQAIVVRPERVPRSQLHHGYAFASGKVFLAAMPQSEVRELLGPPPYHAFTAHTVTSPQAVACALERVRRCGYALDHEEFLEGLCCVAVPLHDAAGRVIAIMSTALPAARATESRLHELTGVLVEHGAAASARLRLERVVAQRYGV
jgi:DNA-binding IclR family transcriptional regulator